MGNGLECAAVSSHTLNTFAHLTPPCKIIIFILDLQGSDSYELSWVTAISLGGVHVTVFIRSSKTLWKSHLFNKALSGLILKALYLALHCSTLICIIYHDPQQLPKGAILR